MASKPVEELRDHLLALGEDTKAAIAARAARRTIPLLEHLPWERALRKGMRKGLGRPRMSNSEMVLGAFRSAATAWVAARFHAFGMSDRFHEIKHDARTAGGIEDAGDTAAAYAAYAVHNAMMVATSVFSQRPPQRSFPESQHRQNAAMSASQTAAAAASGFKAAYAPKPVEASRAARDQLDAVNGELCEVERIVWDAAWSDFRRLATTRNLCSCNVSSTFYSG
jgi:hypothetical protein